MVRIDIKNGKSCWEEVIIFFYYIKIGREIDILKYEDFDFSNNVKGKKNIRIHVMWQSKKIEEILMFLLLLLHYLF